MSSTLYIKNMVCNRCIKVIKDEFLKLNVSIEEIELGKVRISSRLSGEKTQELKKVLLENGFEWIDDKKSRLIDRIKTLIIERTHYSHSGPSSPSINSSDYISRELGHDYSYLSNLFSSIEGITIEKYLINQKIEKVKELLVYDEMSLNEIAYHLGYSSVQHLSSQFKKVTGLTPSHFKKQKDKNRKPLDQI